MAKQLRLAMPELEFEEEFVDPTSGYSIDIHAARRGVGNASDRGLGAGRRWAVEVDGPSHFLQVCDVTEGCGVEVNRDEFLVCSMDGWLLGVDVVGCAAGWE